MFKKTIIIDGFPEPDKWVGISRHKFDDMMVYKLGFFFVYVFNAPILQVIDYLTKIVESKKVK